MAVGEAPGEREDLQGEPFVGAAGQVLTRLMTRIGLSRDDVFITNVLKCRPPANRDPEPDEVRQCSGHLDAQVALIRPDVILLLGRHALMRLVPTAPPISRCHGRRIRADDRLYVPLFHPAAALYNGSLMRTLEEDMDLVRGYLDEADAARAEAAAAVTSDGGADPGGSREQLALF